MLSLLISLFGCIYFANAEVVEIEDNNTIVFETEDGNLWAIESTEYEVGDKIIVKFNNNGTMDNIEDDRVIKIKRGE